MARKTNPFTRFYQIKPGQSGWARIWITDDGCISILSDWGNYGYWFGAPAIEFRAFLLGCDDDYIGRKLGGGKQDFDGDGTVEAVREWILRHRRRGEKLTREEARHEWQEEARRALPSAFVEASISPCATPEAIEVLLPMSEWDFYPVGAEFDLLPARPQT